MGKTSYRAGAFHDDGEAAEGEIREPHDQHCDRHRDAETTDTEEQSEEQEKAA